MDVIWLIPLLPGLGAAANGLFGVRFFSKRTASLVACASMAAALLLSLVAFFELLGLPADAREKTVTVTSWIPAIPLQLANGTVGNFSIPWAFRLDPLSGVMILVVTGIGFLIHVYSIGYMHGEPRGAYARYFAYLNLFVFFMLMLVLGSNFVVMFVGWEGVGLCSYLLIGYYYEKKSASDAGKKAFIVNRIGDWGFILGIFLIYSVFGTLDFRAVANAAGPMATETAGFGTLSLITLLLFVGATGKSAQIPLFVWLPDAMEGPTPVSALIHAATMVTAGVYMVGRNAVLFSHAPMTMEIVAIVGVATALMAATIGLVQNDIKRVLAYSTVSQLGYMFLAMGVGAYAAGAFHLMTHAFFKALLFLCSGSVIHAMAGQQDMRHMGGLKKYMPVTFLTMMVGTLAIAGIPPLSGFFSKDEILYRTFLHSRILWGLAALTALMTAFYMYRLMSMTFFGPYRGAPWEPAHANATNQPGHGGGNDAARGGQDHGGHGTWHGPHEAPRSMTVPLMALAVGAIIAGFVGVPQVLYGGNAIEHFLEPSFVAQTAVAAGHERAAEAVAGAVDPARESGDTPGHGEGAHLPWYGELGLMAFSVLLGVAVFVGVDQAREALMRMVQGELADRLSSQAYLFAFVSLWAFGGWYGARTLLRMRFPQTPPRPIRLEFWARVIPRLAGAGAYLAVATGFGYAWYAAKAVETGVRLALAASIITYVALAFAFLVIVSRRSRGAQPGKPDMALAFRQGDDVFASEEGYFATRADLSRIPWRARVGIGIWMVLTVFYFLLFSWYPLGLPMHIGAVAIFALAVAAWIPFGSLLVGLADRFRVPLFALLALAAVALSYTRANDNHLVRMLAGTQSLVDGRPQARDYLGAWIRARRDEIMASEAYPVLFVAAAGGGARAAYWTAGTLGDLHDACPRIARHLAAASGVSGGSLGLLLYLKTAGPTVPAGTAPGCAALPGKQNGDPVRRARARAVLAEDFIAPTLATMLFPDLTHQLTLIGSWLIRVSRTSRIVASRWSARGSRRSEGPGRRGPRAGPAREPACRRPPDGAAQRTAVETGSAS